MKTVKKKDRISQYFMLAGVGLSLILLMTELTPGTILERWSAGDAGEYTYQKVNYISGILSTNGCSTMAVLLTVACFFVGIKGAVTARPYRLVTLALAVLVLLFSILTANGGAGYLTSDVSRIPPILAVLMSISIALSCILDWTNKKK